jgi:hypothetical protein
MPESERAAILQVPSLRPSIRRKLALKTDDELRFTKSELEHLLERACSGLEFHYGDSSGPLSTLRVRVVELLEEHAPDAFGSELLRNAPKNAVRSDLYFQLHLELLYITPAIWRRIRVQDCTLADLHVCIQAAFGWEDAHLHEFKIGGLRFGPQSEQAFDFGVPLEDEADPWISQIVPHSGKQAAWEYHYDFGDDWQHEIVFEGCAPIERGVKYPRCVEGARACPPEDIGGPWGYPYFLDALADPKHERHAELMAWANGFDPGAFNARQATARMRQWMQVNLDD